MTGEWLVSCPGYFTLKKGYLYIVNRRLCGSQSWYRHFKEKKHLLSLPGFESQTVHFIACLLY
jgi:hypothetical protein